jgi:hypothetical protein
MKSRLKAENSDVNQTVRRGIAWLRVFRDVVVKLLGVFLENMHNIVPNQSF